MTTKIVQLQDLQPGMKLASGHTIKSVLPSRTGRLIVTNDNGRKISADFTAETPFEVIAGPFWQNVKGISNLVGIASFPAKEDVEVAIEYWNATETHVAKLVTGWNSNDPGDSYWTVQALPTKEDAIWC